MRICGNMINPLNSAVILDQWKQVNKINFDMNKLTQKFNK